MDEKLSLILAFAAGLFIRDVVPQLVDLFFHRRKIVFEELHKERAQVIKKTYQLMAYTKFALLDMMSPVREVNASQDIELINKAAQSINQLQAHVESNWLYFEKDLQADLRTLLEKFSRHATSTVNKNRQSISDKDWDSLITVGVETKNDLDTTMREIEVKFKRLIGIDSGDILA